MEIELNLVLLNTDGEVVDMNVKYSDKVRAEPIVKRYNCQQFIRKKVLIKLGDFEYIGYYEYDAETRLYLFRQCSKTRKKNKHDIANGLLDVSRSLEIITGDFWIVRANLNTFEPAELTAEMWSEYRLAEESDHDEPDLEAVEEAEPTAGSDNDEKAEVETDQPNNEEFDPPSSSGEEESSDEAEDSSADDPEDIESVDESGDESDDDDEADMAKQYKKIQNHSKNGGIKKGSHISNEELQMMSAEDPLGDEKSDDEKSYDGEEGEECEDVDDIIEMLDDAPKTASKTKSKGKSKSCITNLDNTLLTKIAKLSSILKPETIPAKQLDNEKRQRVVEILATLEISAQQAKLIEMGIYNYSIAKCKIREFIPLWECFEFCEIYLIKAKSVYSNLNPTCYVGNSDLIEKLKRGEIKPELIGLLPPTDIFPERWNHIIQEKQRREKLMYESTMAKTTDKFLCPNPKCRGRKCVYVEAQIRSADEPMTTFITCLLCGKRFQQ
jgi:hypothetical protein